MDAPEDPQRDPYMRPLKIVLGGSSRVGKTKLMERFLMNTSEPTGLTYGITRTEHEAKARDGRTLSVDICDIGGQEMFYSEHPAHFEGADCCILVFDCTMKMSYKDLDRWLREAREHRGSIPVLVACNKIELDPTVTSKTFAFAEKNAFSLHYVSAADGTNVSALFEAAIEAASTHRAEDAVFLPASDFAPLLVGCVPQLLISADVAEHCCNFLSRLEAAAMKSEGKQVLPPNHQVLPTNQPLQTNERQQVLPTNQPPDYHGPSGHAKIILLGDRAVGKTKLLERFLTCQYDPRSAATMSPKQFEFDTKTQAGRPMTIEFWDVGGSHQAFADHQDYIKGAHCCILVFDVTQKTTYKSMDIWLEQLRKGGEQMPVLVACNKIDTDPTVVEKSFNFAEKHNFPLHYVSASDGTNVVALFHAAIETSSASSSEIATKPE